MAARHQKQQKGKFHAIGQPRGQRMARQMIDRDQRLARRQRQRLGGGQSHHHPADQAGTGRGGNGVDLGQRDVRLPPAPVRSCRPGFPDGRGEAISGTTPP